jgi:hypothetical protein
VWLIFQSGFCLLAHTDDGHDDDGVDDDDWNGMKKVNTE